MSGEWVTFWFEGNQAWGKIDSPKKWERIKHLYGKDCGDAKEFVNSNGPYFGYARECSGTKTLREFFAENGMATGEKEGEDGN